MLAGHITAPGRIELIEASEPELPSHSRDDERPGEILFQPELACLCGSDLPYFEQAEEVLELNVGHSLHEMIGTVTATTGTRFVPGERVLAVPVDQQGLFERFVVSEERAVPLDSRLSDEQAVLAQPLGTVIYALKKLPTVLDRDVAVVGQGPIGQLFNAALRNLGAREIIGIDLLQSRLAASRQTGATATVCVREDDPVSAVAEMTSGRMADIVVEAVGHRDQALDVCIDLTRREGRILYFGVPPQRLDNVRWRDLFRKNLTVHTSVEPDFRRDFPLAMRWIAEGRLDVGPVVTHRFPLDQIQTAFETFRERRDGALKVMIDFPSRAGR